MLPLIPLQLETTLEDCGYRIQALNILLRFAENFKYQLICIEGLLKDREEYENALGELKQFLQTLKKSLEQDLPSSDFANLLDNKLMEVRKNEFKAIMEDVVVMERDLARDGSEKKVEVMSRVMEKLRNHLSRINSLCIEVLLYKQLPSLVSLVYKTYTPSLSHSLRIPSLM